MKKILKVYKVWSLYSNFHLVIFCSLYISKLINESMKTKIFSIFSIYKLRIIKIKDVKLSKYIFTDHFNYPLIHLGYIPDLLSLQFLLFIKAISWRTKTGSNQNLLKTHSLRFLLKDFLPCITWPHIVSSFSSKFSI